MTTVVPPWCVDGGGVTLSAVIAMLDEVRRICVLKGIMIDTDTNIDIDEYRYADVDINILEIDIDILCRYTDIEVDIDILCRYTDIEIDIDVSVDVKI